MSSTCSWNVLPQMAHTPPFLPDSYSSPSCQQVLWQRYRSSKFEVRPDVFVLSGHHHGANRQPLTSSLDDCSRFEPQPP